MVSDYLAKPCSYQLILIHFRYGLTSRTGGVLQGTTIQPGVWFTYLRGDRF